MAESNRTIVHLKTQRGQPYGSERRCCERCGIMIWGPSDICWTDDQVLYESPPEGYVSCQRVEADEREIVMPVMGS